MLSLVSYLNAPGTNENVNKQVPDLNLILKGHEDLARAQLLTKYPGDASIERCFQVMQLLTGVYLGHNSTNNTQGKALTGYAREALADAALQMNFPGKQKIASNQYDLALHIFNLLGDTTSITRVEGKLSFIRPSIDAEFISSEI